MRPEEGQLFGADGCFLRGGAQLRGEHVRVRRIENGCLNLLPENCLRVVHQVGVERVVVGNEHGERVLTASTRAAHALHEGGAGARPARHEYSVQSGDVNAQLQCGGAGQAEQFAVAEFAFEFAALFGGVSGAVCSDAVGEARLHLVEVALGLL